MDSTARCKDANGETALQLFQLLSHFIQVFNPEHLQLAPEKCKYLYNAMVMLSF